MTWQALVGAPCWALALAGFACGLGLLAWGTCCALRAQELAGRPSPIEIRRLLMESEMRRLQASAQRIYCVGAAVLLVTALLALASSRLFHTALGHP